MTQKELQSWEWQFGQTPEFTYTISNVFEWGTAVGRLWLSLCSALLERTDISAQQEVEIKSKHGTILSCRIVCPGIEEDDLQKMGEALSGERYGFVNEGDLTSVFAGSSESASIRCNEILGWLVRATRS